jgi:hypothetical protein
MALVCGPDVNLMAVLDALHVLVCRVTIIVYKKHRLLCCCYCYTICIRNTVVWALQHSLIPGQFVHALTTDTASNKGAKGFETPYDAQMHSLKICPGKRSQHDLHSQHIFA